MPGAREAAADKGVTLFDTGAAAVAGADVVITMLPNGTLVKECYTEVMPAAKPGTLFIDSSTIAVDDARAVHAYAGDRGFAQLDAPVSGGVKRRRSRNPGVHGRRRVRGTGDRTPGAGSHGGQDHSLR